MMEVGDVPVTLVIKAPTQQVNDQTVQCARNWTVERLKQHIASVYPNNPRPADQRLIYYGQLLSDGETLQEVLTRFEGSESVHTFHLVCIPSRDGMRRMPPTNPTPTPPPPPPPPPQPQPQPNVTPQTPQDAYRFYMNPAGYEPWMNAANSGYFQQLAWAQQAYANNYYYFSQYMDMLARQHGVQGLYAAPGTEADGAREAVRAPPEPAPPQRVDDDEHHRDWLDYVYLMARLLVLLSIVYFYSSPVRFLVVSFLGLVLYLYQLGFFRVQNFPMPDNHELLNNNVPQENNNLARAQAQPEEVDPEAESPADAPAEVPAAPQPPPPPSLLAISWTFFSTFFTSLIPDNVNAV